MKQLSEKSKQQCFDCQLKERESEIGKNKKAFESACRGNTMCGGICDTCGKDTWIFYQCDMDRAIRASNNEYIYPFEWD